MGLLDDYEVERQKSLSGLPQRLIGKGVNAFWQSLPPEVRAQWASGARTIPQMVGELSPGAAVRDVVDESGNMVKAAGSGDWIGAGSGPARMAVAALGVMPFVRSGRMTGKAAQETIRAYHGSPHDFDKFSASKIGTGEGAQAFGHGLYFADNEAVARAYREKLSAGRGASVEDIAARAVQGSGGDHAKAIADLESRAANLAERRANSPHTVPEAQRAPGSAPLEQALELLKSGATPGGRMYEVNIHADPNRFINYDVPLAEQSDLVKQALALRQTNTGIGGGPKLYSESTGVYVPDKPNMPAGQVLPVNHPATVEAMEKAGIPGLRFWDRGSRQDATGTKNTVVFPTQQEIIEILRKYGMAPVAAGGAAATVPGLLADDQGNY